MHSAELPSIVPGMLRAQQYDLFVRPPGETGWKHAALCDSAEFTLECMRYAVGRGFAAKYMRRKEVGL